TTIQELTQAKTQISQQTQTDFQTQNKGTQTDLTADQITQLETNNQNLLNLLQATEQELINTKNQLTNLQAALTEEQKHRDRNYEISEIITEFLEQTKKALVKGEEIRLQNYFSLKTATTKARLARNLQTGKQMKIPAKRVPKCKFSAALKEEIAKKK
ncbi:5560_t:CDS:2, partial [Funneliformis geosporum]